MGIFGTGQCFEETDQVFFLLIAQIERPNAPAEKVVYWVVKSVFDNFDSFRKLPPAFANLHKKAMSKDGLSAPLHDGAAKFYKEVGLM